MERLYVCMGGPFDGREFTLSLQGSRVSFPILDRTAVSLAFGQATYEVSGDVLLFITP